MSIERLDVSVLFRNNREFVAPFFFFLRKSTDIPLRVWAVDNGSTDGTSEELKKYGKKGEDRLITVTENRGIAGGRNLVLNAIHEEYKKYPDVLYMDSDLFFINRGSIDKMLSSLNKFPPIGFVHGKIHNYRNFFKTALWGIACTIIRGSVFEKIGTFDEGYKMFWDDTDFMDRADAENFGHYREYEALSTHMWGSTVTLGSEGHRRKEVLKQDKEYFEKKWPGKKLPDYD